MGPGDHQLQPQASHERRQAADNRPRLGGLGSDSDPNGHHHHLHTPSVSGITREITRAGARELAVLIGGKIVLESHGVIPRPRTPLEL